MSLIGDFLASADIKPFGCTYVGRAASYWPHTFLFSIYSDTQMATITKSV